MRNSIWREDKDFGMFSLGVDHCLNYKLSSHGIEIPNGCKHFKILLQLFYGNKANSNKTLRTSKKGTAFQTFEINLWN